MFGQSIMGIPPALDIKPLYRYSCLIDCQTGAMSDVAVRIFIVIHSTKYLVLHLQGSPNHVDTSSCSKTIQRSNYSLVIGGIEARSLFIGRQLLQRPGGGRRSGRCFVGPLRANIFAQCWGSLWTSGWPPMLVTIRHGHVRWARQLVPAAIQI